MPFFRKYYLLIIAYHPRPENRNQHSYLVSIIKLSNHRTSSTTSSLLVIIFSSYRFENCKIYISTSYILEARKKRGGYIFPLFRFIILSALPPELLHRLITGQIVRQRLNRYHIGKRKKQHCNGTLYSVNGFVMQNIVELSKPIFQRY